MRQCINQHRGMSRRDFLWASSAAAAGLLLGACQPKEPPVIAPGSAKVAIASAVEYERKAVYERVRDLLDGIGGLGDIVSAGDRVAIKVNMVGGVGYELAGGLPPTEGHFTHPEVVRALAQMIRDAGAKEILVVEAVWDEESYKVAGYEELAESVGATLIDLGAAEPYNEFASTAVGEGAFTYDRFTFNHILEDVDAFVSVSKMKTHTLAGVTLCMKNLFGLVPARFYQLRKDQNWRSEFHGVVRGPGDKVILNEWYEKAKLAPYNVPKTRLPRVIIDLNRARPIHLALIDGIKTVQGGEGPWHDTMCPIEPGILLAGKDPVATDAVATAAMGFDPTADYPLPPFVICENYLNLARTLGLGTNRLDEIEVVGHSIDDVGTEFPSCWG